MDIPSLHNQSLQQTLDPVATLAVAKPAPASIAAEPRRYAALDTLPPCLCGSPYSASSQAGTQVPNVIFCGRSNNHRLSAPYAALSHQNSLDRERNLGVLGPQN